MLHVTLVFALSLQVPLQPSCTCGFRPALDLRGPKGLLQLPAAGSALRGLIMSEAPAAADVSAETPEIPPATAEEEAADATGSGDAGAGASPAPSAFQDFDRNSSPVRIQVVGVGGGGGNTVGRMIDTIGAQGNHLQFACMNTDLQALSASKADLTLQLGEICTRGLGAGGKPSVGREAALESQEEIARAVSEFDLVFVTAGMGGGTGSGAAPVVAQLAREAGSLVVGVVSRPFAFEGAKRQQQAQEAVEQLIMHVDILIVVSNDRLLNIMPEGIPMADAFLVADEILRQAQTNRRANGEPNTSPICNSPLPMCFRCVRAPPGRAWWGWATC